MQTLLIAVGAGIAFIIAYHTYGRWLGSRIFNLAADAVCPSERLRDDTDYVPTPKSVVFGHHFTSIAGTGPIVGPAIAVMWGWLPALLWVVLGSIFIGAVHDLGSLVVSLRNNGQTVGDIAGRVLNRRVRLLFLFVLFMALTIVLAIFGLVIGNVFKLYPASIFPCLVQIPLAVAIGFWLHRKGVSLLVPSLIALVVMYLTVVFGDQNTRVGISFFDDTIGGALHSFNEWMAGLPIITWVAILLVYSYIASVLPVWTLLQPRDYINSLQLISALGLVVLGLVVAAFIGGAPPVQGAERVPLEIVAPMVNWRPEGAPLIFPFLFITIACGAISGFHCLVSSGTSSKQLKKETDAKFVGYGSMLTEGFLATIVILACVAGLGLGTKLEWSPLILPEIASLSAEDAGIRRSKATYVNPEGESVSLERRGVRIGRPGEVVYSDIGIPEYPFTDAPVTVDDGLIIGIASAADDQLGVEFDSALVGPAAFNTRYESWTAANGLARTVGAFVDGSANFLAAMGIPHGVAIALMGVLVASFAGTTLDTACRLQRYVVQELAATFAPQVSPTACAACGYDLSFNVSKACPECGAEHGSVVKRAPGTRIVSMNPIVWLTNKHVATIFAIVIAAAIAAMPGPGKPWSWTNAGGGGLILWPMFGATNQLLGGLAFLVISFWLWRRKKPVWFAVIPMIFMLCMPLLAMGMQLFWGEGSKASWWDQKNYVLIFIGLATLALEVWMVIEAILLWPKVKGVLEQQLPGNVEPAA
jgi:carbon starvation protein